ncbi:hypothetical protein EV363DRAFT_661059 [Boletus edulis]|nr:hypothetical protein EV363DRAFT_661059 [Boletus edulis]
MPYPTAHPDSSVFEPLSNEYTAVSTPGSHHFTPLSSSETLASLVSQGDFQAADALRKEMIAHHIPIPRDALYLRAALHAITQRRLKGSESAQQRVDALEAWLSLAPDRHEEWQSFHDIRQKLFRSMDHLNLTLVYRFGLVLTSKGYYSGDAAVQVVSTLARYARLSVVERYLRQVEDASRDYHSNKGTVPPSDLLAGAYNLSIRTVALGGKAEAALALISVAQLRGIQISDFTLNIVAKHAPERQLVIDRIRTMYPSWTLGDIDADPVTVESKAIPVGQTADITVLAARLRSLRIALRSPSPPSPRALYSFITSYQALGRTRGLALLRTLAYRHSPKSASTWAFTEMLYHRSRREFIHLLLVFSQHFHLVGVPCKTLLSFIRGTRGQQARKEPVQRWVVAPCPMKGKLWPSAHHSALVWEAIVLLSPTIERERLYGLLLSLVRQSRLGEQEPIQEQEVRVPDVQARVRLELPPDTYDAAHFSPFVSSWARRRPVRAAGIMRDMVHVGVEPTMIQWSMVARGYAQHDDPLVALRILERLEELERGRVEEEEEGQGDPSKRWSPSDVLLGVHTNVLRGFVLRGDVQHAREVERRLVERLGYQAGDRPTTDASMVLLRGLEAEA